MAKFSLVFITVLCLVGCLPPFNRLVSKTQAQDHGWNCAKIDGTYSCSQNNVVEPEDEFEIWQKIAREVIESEQKPSPDENAEPSSQAIQAQTPAERKNLQPNETVARIKARLEALKRQADQAGVETKMISSP